MERYLLLFLLTVSMGQLFAQPYETIKDIDILEQQEEVLRQKYGHEFNDLEILGGDRINERYTLVGYKKNEIYHEAVMDSERKEMMLVSIAAEVPVDDMPVVVMNAFEDGQYGDLEVVKTFNVSTPYGENFFAIDVKKDETIERIYYNELGVRQKALY